MVACSSDAFSKRVVILTSSERLATAENPWTKMLQPQGEPWGLRLQNGDECIFLVGATEVVAGLRLNYACNREWIIGFPDRSTVLWTVKSVEVLQKNPKVRRKEITEAVF